MKRIAALLVAMAVLLGSVAVFAVEYNAKWNEARIEEISNEVFRQVVAQRKAFDRAMAEYQKATGGNNNNNDGGPGAPGGEPNGGQVSSGPAPQKPVYKLDVDLIKAAIRKKFPARGEDALGGNPKVDARSRMDVVDALRPVLLKQYEAAVPGLKEQEIKDAEKEYPLYKPGQMVDIRFALGRETPRTYKGVYKTVGKFKITIGPHMLSRADLPDLIKPRFDPKLNEEARRNYVAKHPLLNKHFLDFESKLAEMARETLLKQFEKNLPQGWIYFNNTWRMPEEIVQDVLASRKNNVEAHRRW